MSPDPDEDLLRNATRGDHAAFVAYCARKIPGARDFFVKALRRNWKEVPHDRIEDFLRETIDRATSRLKPSSGGWPPDAQREHVLFWLRRGSAGELLRRTVAGDPAAFIAFTSLAMPDL